jgi:hypothetical protein
MRDNHINDSFGGYANAAKAVAGFSVFVNGVFEIFKNFTLRIRDGQAETKDQLDSKRQAEKQCHRITSKPMPLEQLIRTGFYPF